MGAFNLTATRFAHLLGPLARSSHGSHAARAEDDDKDDKDKDDDARAEDERDDDDRKKDDDDGRARKSKRSKKSRAEDDGDEARAEDDDNDDEARAADEDDQDHDDRKDDAKATHARRAERARCAQIFRCTAAGRRPDVAAHLAFDTSMCAVDAVALLHAIASGDGARAAHADTLRARMAGVSLPAIGSDGGTPEDRDGPQAAASLILAAARRARGEA
ncbi:hypothetical protein [Caballeronia sp. BR00000012568055]|uniref:hypothetical protein n=1 Tax=Caballeronia sp. BR00000012568055 TaxID=2918761 RepID=UPI0023F9F51F|nr:hypothetical protein [Caballeronia sp. BR00000012568055]